MINLMFLGNYFGNPEETARTIGAYKETASWSEFRYLSKEEEEIVLGAAKKIEEKQNEIIERLKNRLSEEIEKDRYAMCVIENYSVEFAKGIAIGCQIAKIEIAAAIDLMLIPREMALGLERVLLLKEIRPSNEGRFIANGRYASPLRKLTVKYAHIRYGYEYSGTPYLTQEQRSCAEKVFQEIQNLLKEEKYV